MKKICKQFALAVLLLSGGHSLKACDLSYIIPNTIALEDAPTGRYLVTFTACIGGGATTTPTWLPGADTSTVNMMFAIWPSSVRFVASSLNPYPNFIATPMPTTCTNCQRLKSYENQRRRFADPSSTQTCPVGSLTCTASGSADCVWYTANDTTNACWGAPNCELGTVFGYACSTGQCCSALYPVGGSNRRPAFVDQYAGVGARAAYCWSMYLRFIGRPDSLSMLNNEVVNTMNPVYCKGKEDINKTDQTIAFRWDGSDPVAMGYPLPIQWLFVNGTANTSTQSISINWGTAIEDLSDYFLIMKSVDGVHFTTIGNVDSKRVYDGTSEYEILDPNPVKGRNYYKILNINKFGSTEISNVAEVIYDGEVNSHINYISPVPTENIAVVSFYSNADKIYEVVVFDIRGRVILQSELKASPGENKMNVDLSREESGVYFINFISGKEKIGGKLLKS